LMTQVRCSYSLNQLRFVGGVRHELTNPQKNLAMSAGVRSQPNIWRSLSL
jgi:hypothetical protein